MKKLIFIITIVLVLVSCRQHVYHTYYGDIDTDTMDVAFTRGNQLWYKVHYSEKDSFKLGDEIIHSYGPFTDYYCPSTNTYEETFPDNQGRIVCVDIDPYQRDNDLNNK